MFKYSTKCFNAMLSALDTQFTNGVIELRTGAQPASPDDAATGTLIAVATRDAAVFVPGSPGNGLNFATPVLNVMGKEPAEVWRFTAIASGTIGWGRLKGNGVDAGDASTILPRIDASVGITSGEMRTSKVTYALNEVGSVDSFNITLTNI